MSTIPVHVQTTVDDGFFAHWPIADLDDVIPLLATAVELAPRLGYADRSGVTNAVARAGRTDLLDRLNRNAEIAGHNVRHQTRKADAA